MMNKAVEAARLPPEKHEEAFGRVEKELSASQTVLVRVLVPSLIHVSRSYRRNQANLRCAAIGVSAEQYRLKHNEWPATLEELVKAKLLETVPVDPFDGRPLRYKTLPDGVVIYAVGEDGVDNGGVLNRSHRFQQGTDFGFRLWDVGARRQASLPPPPPEELGGPP
jgi:hypothetical protein